MIGKVSNKKKSNTSWPNQLDQIKLKAAVFISGKGSNLNSLIKFSKSKKSPIEIILILSSNSKAKGLYLSKKYRITKKFILLKKKELMSQKY